MHSRGRIWRLDGAHFVPYVRRRLQVAIAMRSYPKEGNTRRIPLGKAVTSCLYRVKNILEERRFDVHWARHKPEKGGDRWQVRSDCDHFEVHLGHKKNITLREVDSIVIKGLKGWRPLVLDWVESILLDESQ